MSIPLISKTPLYKGFMKLFRIDASYESKDGKSIEAKFELLERNDCASILLYDKSGKVLLLSQFRPGAISHSPSDPYVVELIAGVIEDGDKDPVYTALREAEEESGVKAEGIKNIQSLGSFYLSPGGSNERTHLFIAETDFSVIDTSKIYGLDSERESIEIMISDIDFVLKNIDSFQINITLYAALLAVKVKLVKS